MVIKQELTSEKLHSHQSKDIQEQTQKDCVRPNSRNCEYDGVHQNTEITRLEKFEDSE